MQTEHGPTNYKAFQFPKLHRGTEADRHLSEQTLKLLLKKKKDELRLSKPLLFPSQMLQEERAEPQSPEQADRVLDMVTGALLFAQTYIETKTSSMVHGSITSVGMLMKDKDETTSPPEGEDSRYVCLTSAPVASEPSKRPSASRTECAAH
jgi:hypothetical protein